ncbi:MAG: hypothetical protein R2828_35815 [Saprospiraceae bacterium]
MPLSKKEQTLISTMLQRLLKSPGADKEAITDALAKPIQEFNQEDWDLVNQALPQLTEQDIELTPFIRLNHRIPTPK